MPKVHTTTDTIDTPWGPQRMFVRYTAGAPATAPVVVLVHGLGVSSRYMVPLMQQLQGVANVFAPDLLGFGRSQKPPFVLNIEELADALAIWMKVRGLANACLVGNSMGCQVIVNLAQRHAALPACLVLVGPTMDGSASALKQVLRWISMAFVEPVRLLPLLFRDYLAAGFMRTFRTFRFALQDKIEQRIERVSQQVLVVRGGQDRIVTAAWAKSVTEHAGNGRLITIAAGAHAINFDAPRALARILRRVLHG